MIKFKFLPHFFIIFCLFNLTRTTFALEVEFEESKNVPLVFINIGIKGAGSVSDPEGKDGLSSLLGQMLLRGTVYKTKEQLDTLLDQLGASLSVSARTEALEFSGSVLSKELDRFLDLLNEVLSKPSFNEKELMKLKAETLSSLSHIKSNDSSLMRYYWPHFIFPNHPYGKIKSGLEKTLKNISTEDLKAHYKNLFQTNQLIIVGSGDALPQKIVSWGKKIQLNPNTEKKLSYAAPEFPKQKKVILLDKPNRTQASILISHKGSSIQSDDYYPFTILNHAFGGSSFQARLMQELRVKTGWSYGAGSNFLFATFPYAWSIQYQPAKQFLENSLKQTLLLIKNLQETGITKEEFEFAKSALILSSGFSYDTPFKRVSNAMNEKLLGLPKGFYEKIADKLNTITLAEVNLLAHKFFQPDQLVITVVATAADSKEAISKGLSIPVNQITVYPYDKVEDFLNKK